MTDLIKPARDLAGQAIVDSARLVTLVAYEGKGINAAAKVLGVTPKEVQAELQKKSVLKMIETAQKDRLPLIAHIPIANMANRLARLERIANESAIEGDHTNQLRAIKEAREETKDQIGQSNHSGPRIIVNIAKLSDSNTNSKEDVLTKPIESVVDAVFGEVDDDKNVQGRSTEIQEISD